MPLVQLLKERERIVAVNNVSGTYFGAARLRCLARLPLEEMKMNRRVLSILLLVSFGLLVGIIVDRAASKSTNAQPVAKDESERWEYAVISSVNWDSERRAYYARICYFRTSGCQYFDIQAPPLSEGEEVMGTIKMFAKAAATLGQSGWELVGEATIGRAQDGRLFFKRRQK